MRQASGPGPGFRPTIRCACGLEPVAYWVGGYEDDDPGRTPRGWCEAHWPWRLAREAEEKTLNGGARAR